MKKPYQSLDQLFEDLREIKPIDFTTEETSMDQAIRFSKEVLECLVAAKDFDYKLCLRAVELADALKSIGCVKWEDAAPKFRAMPYGEEGAYAKGSTALPLDCFSNLIRGTKLVVRKFCEYVGDGFINAWLRNQNVQTME